MKKKQQTELYIRESLSSGEERVGGERLLRKKQNGEENGGKGAKRVVCLQFGFDPMGFGFDPMGLGLTRWVWIRSDGPGWIL